MKKMTAAILMALILVINTAVTAFALDVTVTIPENLNNHSFKAYQVFKGTQAESDGPLGSIEWGSGINSEEFLAGLKSNIETAALFEACVTAEDVADVLSSAEDSIVNTVAKIAYKNIIKDKGVALVQGKTVLESGKGYYLIVDESNVSGQNMAANAALLQVTNSIEITQKTDKPSVEKKVLENAKYRNDDGYGEGFNDVADYCMGDVVTFRLIGTIPDLTYYDTYRYIFHDSLDNGFNMSVTDNLQDAVRVYLSDDKKLTTKTDITDKFTLNYQNSENKQQITISCNDIKKIDGVSTDKYIIVEYKTVLNQNAVVGLDGNVNDVYLEYSNKPDNSGEGNGEGENVTGKTPVDAVIVFTYAMDINKVDEKDNSKKLADAVFQLKNSAGKYAVVSDENKITDWTDDENDVGTKLTSDVNGLVKVIGLDQGEYKLVEIEAPSGYNLPAQPFEVEITASTVNGQTWLGLPREALTGLSVSVGDKTGSVDDKKSTVGITIGNSSGVQLPETGGIGTVIIYAVGAALVLGAIVLFIVKKRSGAKN